jgi:hypothetical protein
LGSVLLSTLLWSWWAGLDPGEVRGQIEGNAAPVRLVSPNYVSRPIDGVTLRVLVLNQAEFGSRAGFTVKCGGSAGRTRCRVAPVMLTGKGPSSNVQNELGPGSFAGNTHRGLEGCGSKPNRNPRLRFGLVWSPGTGLQSVTRTATRLNQPGNRQAEA